MSETAAPPPRRPDPDGEGAPHREDAGVVPQITQKQARRINAPIRGMLISMTVLMLLVLPFLWLHPKPDAQPYRADVDVAQEAQYVAEQAPFTPATPGLGEGWSANYARWNPQSQDGLAVWEVGYLSPGYHLVELQQTGEANPTWLAQRTGAAPVTRQETLSDVTWDVHHRAAAGKQEAFTAWVGKLRGSTVVLSGKATDEEFEHVARALGR